MSAVNVRYDRAMDKPSRANADVRHLERAALAYLDRFPASAATLRRVLMRRLRRAAGNEAFDPARAEALVAGLLSRLAEAGLIDDDRYAGALARNLLGRGVAPAMIAHRLAAKGITRDAAERIAASLIAEAAEEGRDADLEAARALARKRRLGPWRTRAADRDRRERELAVLGRAGFSRRIARQVLGEDEDGEDGG